MSVTPDEESTATPPPAAPVEPPPAPAPARASTARSVLHNRPLQFTAVGLAGLLIGCAVGGGVVAIVSHHGDRFERHHDQRFEQRPRIIDQRDRGPLRQQPPQPRRFPMRPGPTAPPVAPALPTPLPSTTTG